MMSPYSYVRVSEERHWPYRAVVDLTIQSEVIRWYMIRDWLRDHLLEDNRKVEWKRGLQQLVRAGILTKDKDGVYRLNAPDRNEDLQVGYVSLLNSLMEGSDFAPVYRFRCDVFPQIAVFGIDKKDWDDKELVNILREYAAISDRLREWNADKHPREDHTLLPIITVLSDSIPPSRDVTKEGPRLVRDGVMLDDTA